MYSAPDELGPPENSNPVSTTGRDSAEEAYQLGNVLPNMERDEYFRAIETVLDYIAAGDTYQVNYTFNFL